MDEEKYLSGFGILTFVLAIISALGWIACMINGAFGLAWIPCFLAMYFTCVLKFFYDIDIEEDEDL
jgi:hypothetical protein